MQERNVSVENLQVALEGGRLFAYYHNGLIKIGYYDVANNLFLSVDQRHERLITAIRKSSPDYVERLINSGKLYQ